MPKSNLALKASRPVVLAAICVTVAALYLARDVLIPLALSILVTFLLAPLVLRLERRGIPRVPSVIIVVGVVLALVAVLGWIVYLQIIELADRLPQYRGEIVAKVRSFSGPEPGALERAAETIKDVGEAVTAPETQPATTTTAPSDAISGIFPIDPSLLKPARGATPDDPVYVRPIPDDPSLLRRLQDYAPSAAAVLGTVGLVVVFAIFILLSREDLRDRLIRLVGYGQLNVTTQALDDAASRISRFLLAQAIVNGSYGVAISIGLWLIGYLMADEIFPNFVLWGLLCAVLRFIPYVGPWIAAAFPMALAFAVFPGYSVFIAVAVMFIIVEILSNNLMEPWLYGSSTGMSTLAVIVSAVFWTWLWGPIGLVMATPLTVCLVVIGKHVPQLKFFDILLGDEPVLAPSERVYQRLLAMDQEEATEVAEEYLKTQSLEELFDTVLLPALALAEQDRHAGRLDDERSHFIRSALRQMIDELADEQRAADVREQADATARKARGEEEPAAPTSAPDVRARIPEGCTVNIVLLPAHDEADEIVGIMLATLLDLRGYCASPVSHNALASEMLDEVDRRSADAVVVSALPPAAVAHARYLCKRLHARFPDISTMVGLWTVQGDLKHAQQRILCAQTVRFATTFTQAMQELRELVQHKLVPSTTTAAEKSPSVQPA